MNKYEIVIKKNEVRVYYNNMKVGVYTTLTNALTSIQEHSEKIDANS